MGVVFVMTDELYVKLSVLVLAVAILAAPGSTRERWSMGGADPNIKTILVTTVIS